MSPAPILTIVPMEARHGVEIRRQESQRLQLGLAADITLELAEQLAAGAEAWAAIEQGETERVVAIFGLKEAFGPGHVLAWATLSDAVGASAHLQISRFIARRIAAYPGGRIEAIVECCDIEPIAALVPTLDPWQLAIIALERPTPGMRWASTVGLMPVAVLRKFGAAGETHMLFERIKP